MQFYKKGFNSRDRMAAFQSATAAGKKASLLRGHSTERIVQPQSRYTIKGRAFEAAWPGGTFGTAVLSPPSTENGTLTKPVAVRAPPVGASIESKVARATRIKAARIKRRNRS